MRFSVDSSIRILVSTALVVAYAAAGRGEEPAPPPRLSVHVKVIRVNVSKVKHLGFVWERLLPGGRQTVPVEFASFIEQSEQPREFAGFLEALVQNSLGHIVAEPTLVTLSGRPASLKVGGTQLDVVPVALDDGRVQLDCRLEYKHEDEKGQPNVAQPSTGGTTTIDSAVILPVGKTFLLCHAPSQVPIDGSVTEYHWIILAKVDRVTH